MKPRAAIIIVLLSCAFAADAFSVVPRSCASSSTASRTTTRRRQAAAVVEQEDVTEAVALYDQLGIERGNLALGVKPDEVLKYIGTYVYNKYYCVFSIRWCLSRCALCSTQLFYAIGCTVRLG